jgi:hypothetical protein
MLMRELDSGMKFRVKLAIKVAHLIGGQEYRQMLVDSVFEMAQDIAEGKAIAIALEEDDEDHI